MSFDHKKQSCTLGGRRFLAPPKGGGFRADIKMKIPDLTLLALVRVTKLAVHNDTVTMVAARNLFQARGDCRMSTYCGDCPFNKGSDIKLKPHESGCSVNDCIEQFIDVYPGRTTWNEYYETKVYACHRVLTLIRKDLL